jgi:hypothetical protein
MESRGFTRAGAEPESNEDSFVAGPHFAVVVDGATAEPGAAAGCSHGVRWFVAELCGGLAARLIRDGSGPVALPELLHAVLADVAAAHAATCDLSNPGSPSATVAMLRWRGDHVDYLVLGDSAVVLDLVDGALRVTVDDRIARFAGVTWPELRSLRNTEEGFWVAGARPDAAARALTGRAPAASIARGVLLTDGAYRLVEHYGWSWRRLADLVVRDGPAALTAATRAVESAQPAPLRQHKPHDDATVVLCQPVPSQ